MPQKPQINNLALRGLVAAAETPEEPHVQEIRDIFQKAANINKPRLQQPLDSVKTGLAGINVRPPAGFRPDPVVPNDELAIGLQALYKIAPDAKGYASRVDAGPNDAVIEDLLRSGLQIDDYAQTNLLGAWRPRDRSMFIRPEQMPGRSGRWNADYDNSITSTLLHETGHSVGLPHGPDIENLEGLARMMTDAQGMKEGLEMSPWGTWRPPVKR